MPIGPCRGRYEQGTHYRRLTNKQYYPTSPYCQATFSSIFQKKLLSVFSSLSFRSCFQIIAKLSPFFFVSLSHTLSLSFAPNSHQNHPRQAKARENDRGFSAAIAHSHSPPRCVDAPPNRLQPCAPPRNKDHRRARAKRSGMAHRRNTCAKGAASVCIIARRAAATTRLQHHLRLDRGRCQLTSHVPRRLALRRRHRKQGNWLLSGRGALYRGNLYRLRRCQQPAAD